MNEQDVLRLLERVQNGTLSVAEAAAQMHELPEESGLADLGFARIDLERQKRQGVPEVVFGENKSTEQLLLILQALVAAGQSVLITRVSADKAEAVCRERHDVRYNVVARTLVLEQGPPKSRLLPAVAIVTAGTSDIPVAEEAVETLQLVGIECDRIYDVGVAGIHRLFAEIERIRSASAVIVCAGMEGALPSVLGGLVAGPVVAVPTSVGYGAALSGFSALLGMLTSCAAGVVVVNIDNGFGAAMAVVRLLHAQGASR